MSNFETPIMRDISKLLPYVLLSLLMSLGMIAVLTWGDDIYRSIEWELEQLDNGFTWEDKQGTCFRNENGVTYLDTSFNGTSEMVTSTMSCYSGALPWEILSWQLPLLGGLIITIVWLHRKQSSIGDKN